MTWATAEIAGVEYAAAIRSPTMVEVYGLPASVAVGRIKVEGVARNCNVVERYENRVLVEMKRGK
jgi:hypothetical protein